MYNFAKMAFSKLLQSTYVAYWYFYSLELRYEDKGGNHFVAAFACFFSIFLFIAGLSGLISLFDLMFPNYKWLLNLGAPVGVFFSGFFVFLMVYSEAHLVGRDYLNKFPAEKRKKIAGKHILIHLIQVQVPGVLYLILLPMLGLVESY